MKEDSKTDAFLKVLRIHREVVFIFCFAVAPPGLLRPDVVDQTFFCCRLPGFGAKETPPGPGRVVARGE